MNYHVYFSPTGGTERIVRYAGKAFPGAEIDLSREVQPVEMTGEDFAIVAVPSFGGRVPAIAGKRLENLRGQKTPALLLVTYGARAYEDTLREGKNILNRQGFVCVGATAMVTPHSIVPTIGAGRPNEGDWEKLDTFLLTVKNAWKGSRRKSRCREITPIRNTGCFPWRFRRVGTAWAAAFVPKSARCRPSRWKTPQRRIWKSAFPVCAASISALTMPEG